MRHLKVLPVKSVFGKINFQTKIFKKKNHFLFRTIEFLKKKKKIIKRSCVKTNSKRKKFASI